MQTPHYKQIKRQTRAWVRKGMSKVEAAGMANVHCVTVNRWTRDIKLKRGYKRIGGFTLALLAKLISEGYAFPESQKAYSSFRVLRRYFPTIKMARYNRLMVFYLEGNERKAMEAFLKKTNLRSINYGKLGAIQQAFGIKRYEREFNKRKVLG